MDPFGFDNLDGDGERRWINKKQVRVETITSSDENKRDGGADFRAGCPLSFVSCGVLRGRGSEKVGAQAREGRGRVLLLFLKRFIHQVRVQIKRGHKELINNMSVRPSPRHRMQTCIWARKLRGDLFF